jgi:hypothetical protein
LHLRAARAAGRTGGPAVDAGGFDSIDKLAVIAAIPVKDGLPANCLSGERSIDRHCVHVNRIPVLRFGGIPFLALKVDST